MNATAATAESRTGPPVFEFIVDAGSSGIRIDSFLARQLRNYQPWRLQRITRAGGVLINESPAEQTDRVFTGQRIRVRLMEPPDKLLRADPIPVPILYEDAWLLVLNKPAGMVVHPTGSQQQGTLANALQWLLDQRGPRRGILRPGLVHRLDRQTSGVIAVAVTYDAHVGLAAAFEQSRVSKSYLALVEGCIGPAVGVMDWPIGRTPLGRQILMSCRGDALDARPARTHFEVLRRYKQHTLLRARPRTGRNHQIRVHFARLGYPLVGDEFYERGGTLKPFNPELRSPEAEETSREVETGLPIRRHALHAEQLEFAHPITGAWLSIRAPLPEDFRQTLQQLAAGDSPDL